MFRLVRCLLIMMLCAQAAQAEDQVSYGIEMDAVTICPARTADEPPPDFTAAGCRTIRTDAIDPQSELIWVRATIEINAAEEIGPRPLALFVSGKMAAAFYLNGVFVGRNGIPGRNRSEETPGQMDAVLHPPQTLFRPGTNELVFLASSHHGFLNLHTPIHWIFAGPAENPADRILRYYWPSLVTLGLFVLGALYFGIMAIIGETRRRALIFCLICGFAAAQLLSEVARGLISYSYPLHDVRLVLITLFSAGFGLSVAFQVLTTFMTGHIGKAMAAIAVAALAGITLAPGFDSKAQLAMMIPLAVSLIATAWWSYERRPRAFVHFLILLTFVLAIGAFPSMFLDVVFFYVVAAFVLMLFLEQGIGFAREQRRRRIEQARADRLELALEQAQQREQASELTIKSAGRMERISTNDIVSCKGADGYTEILLGDGREILHGATLAEMEETLPATFLRVHRSHLVNTSRVQSLRRDASGTGALILADGSEVPVSRRIMPQVRQALG